MFISCTDEVPELSNRGVVHGSLTNMLTGEGVEDVVVYLLDRQQEVDTITYQNNIVKVDSTNTDSTGYYRFDSIPPGSYSVAPFDPSMEIRHDSSSHSYDVDIIDDEEFVVDFELTPSLRSGSFKTTLRITNAINQYNSQADCWVYVARRYWLLLFYSSLEYTKSVSIPHTNDNIYEIEWHSIPGFFGLVYNLDNFFRVEIGLTNKSGTPSGGNYIYLETPINNTPTEVEWEYNYSTSKLIRIK